MDLYFVFCYTAVFLIMGSVTVFSFTYIRFSSRFIMNMEVFEMKFFLLEGKTIHISNWFPTHYETKALIFYCHKRWTSYPNQIFVLISLHAEIATCTCINTTNIGYMKSNQIYSCFCILWCDLLGKKMHFCIVLWVFQISWDLCLLLCIMVFAILWVYEI